MTKLLAVLALTLSLVSCGNNSTVSSKAALALGNCYVVTFGDSLNLIRLTDKIGNNTFTYEKSDGKYVVDKGYWFVEGENYESIDCGKIEFNDPTAAGLLIIGR